MWWDGTWPGSDKEMERAAGPEDVERLFSLGGIKRRDFLKISALIAAGLIIPAGCSSPQNAWSPSTT